MVSALDSRSSGPGSSPGHGHCVVFLNKTFYSNSTSFHPGVQMGTGELKTGVCSTPSDRNPSLYSVCRLR